MKIRKNQIIVFAIIIVAVAAIVFQLKGNKMEMQNDIALAQRTVEKIPVSVEAATNGILSEKVHATGTLEAAEVLNLVSETQGKIIAIYKRKGDNIKAGETIVKVDDEVIAANALTAEANHTQFQKDVERLTRLSEENAVTKRDLEQTSIGLKKAKADLINAQKALSNTSIKAPISGYINSEKLTIGQFLAGGSSVCEIVNNSTLKLNIKVSEREVYKISKGQSVEVLLTAFPEKSFSGRINSIAEKADEAMKFNVEIILNNDDLHLKAGLYAEAIIPVQNEQRVIINKKSIVGSMESPTVFVAQNGKAIKRSITIGYSNNSQVEVMRGLSAGEEVVISGQLNLKDGDEINISK